VAFERPLPLKGTIYQPIATDIYRYRIIIQSEKPPTYLEEKIEAFLDLLQENIMEMSAADFSSHVKSLVLSLSETPKYLGKETWRYWTDIESGFYDFKRREIPLVCDKCQPKVRPTSPTLKISLRRKYCHFTINIFTPPPLTEAYCRSMSSRKLIISLPTLRSNWLKG
jgi:hypothetical protein